jgi:hypothetical protein|nr:MAG TPA: hypothetical protein [Caudoviricetes sp.]
MELYYQAVMDKSKLTEANRLYNKINNLKSELKAVSRFETDTRVTVANQYDSYFHVEGETINRILAVAKESMERELEEYERLFSEL